MKFKTTQKAIRANYNKIICVPYCGLQTLLNYENPVAYTIRHEGWAADIYDMGGGVAIVTGYAPFEIFAHLMNCGNGTKRKPKKSGVIIVFRGNNNRNG